MKAAPFEYHAVDTADEAQLLLQAHRDDAKVLAGGQSLLPMMNLRLARPERLIDLNRVTALDYVREAPDGLLVGAMTRQRTLERSEAVARRAPLLRAALGQVAHFQIRNRGTVGGSIAHADAAAELPAVLLALGGSVTASSASRGSRVIPAAALFRGPFTTSLEPDEIITGVFFPDHPPGSTWGFREFARRHGDYALAGVAVLATSQNGDVSSVVLTLFAVGGTPVRSERAERILVETGDPQAVADVVQAELRPVGSVHGSTEYRRHLAGVLTVRALKDALRD